MKYVPNLFTKPAEYKAYRTLPGDVLDTIEPCFICTPLNVPYEDSNASKILEENISKSVTALADCLNGQPLIRRPQKSYLDLGRFNPWLVTTQGRHPLTAMFDGLRDNGVFPKPVARLSMDQRGIAAIHDEIRRTNYGCGVRLTSWDFEHPGLEHRLEDLIEYLATDPMNVDLMVDIGPTSSTTPGFLFYLDKLKKLNQWREIILIGGGFPKDLTKIPEGIYEQLRYEWLYFLETLEAGIVEGQSFSFGDYTTRHPLYSQPAEKFPPSPSVRFTGIDAIKIYRGKRSEDKSNGAQYRQHARKIAESVDYPGEGYCYGDKFIAQVAARTIGPGGAFSWIVASESHHMTFMGRQIKRLGVLRGEGVPHGEGDSPKDSYPIQ